MRSFKTYYINSYANILKNIIFSAALTAVSSVQPSPKAQTPVQTIRKEDLVHIFKKIILLSK